MEQEKQETQISLEVPPGYREGERLDVYITRFLPNASRSKVQRGIKEGNVTVDGVAVTRVSHTVQAGDEIVCTIMRPPPIEAAPEDIPLEIVYEDDHLIIVNKPAGMVVHPAYGNRTGTLVNALLHHVGAGAIRFDTDDDEEDLEDEEVGLSTVNAAPQGSADVAIRPGIVHRLDKDTSGLMVVAKDDVTHRELALQFFNRTIRRQYLALVWGVPDPPDDTIETSLGRDPRDRKRMAVVRPGAGKHAVTHYWTIERFAHAALVGFRLETGRTHQIRVHARHIGHPVMGDATYDGQRLRNGPDTTRRRTFYRNLFEKMPRQALHAHTLGFIHPATGDEMDFVAEPPEDMQYVISRVRAIEPE